jgi:hypothetical protein
VLNIFHTSLRVVNSKFPRAFCANVAPVHLIPFPAMKATGMLALVLLFIRSIRCFSNAFVYTTQIPRLGTSEVYSMLTIIELVHMKFFWNFTFQIKPSKVHPRCCIAQAMQSEQYSDRLITSNPLFNEIMVMTRDSSNSRMKTRSGKLRSKTKQI